MLNRLTKLLFTVYLLICTSTLVEADESYPRSCIDADAVTRRGIGNSVKATRRQQFPLFWLMSQTAAGSVVTGRSDTN